MKLINNQRNRYEASSTHQFSTSMTMPEESNDDVVQQNIVPSDDDDEIVAVSGLLLASMTNIIREMEERRRDRSNSRRLPNRRRQRNSRDGPSSAQLQLPQALFDTQTRTRTTLLRRFVSNDDEEDDVNSQFVATPCKNRTTSNLIDIADEALQVVSEPHGSNDPLYDFHFMPEETSVVVLGLNSKSTAKRYSCNKEGDCLETLHKNNSR
jgi:hypothetical protein